MDTETNIVLQEGQDIADYVNSRGWKQVKDLFLQKILDLQSIKNIPKGITPTMKAREIDIRETIGDMLLEIIKDVEGKAQQHTGNLPLTRPAVEIIN